MSSDSLKQFIDEKFLNDETIQNQLKATDSLDEFANLMVSLGGDLNYSFTDEEVRALVIEKVEKDKEGLDEESQHDIDKAMATIWKKGKFVEVGIEKLLDSPVRPCYP